MREDDPGTTPAECIRTDFLLTPPEEVVFNPSMRHLLDPLIWLGTAALPADIQREIQAADEKFGWPALLERAVIMTVIVFIISKLLAAKGKK